MTFEDEPDKNTDVVGSPGEIIGYSVKQLHGESTGNSAYPGAVDRSVTSGARWEDARSPRPYTRVAPDGRRYVVDDPHVQEVSVENPLVPVGEQQLAPELRRYLTNVRSEAHSWILISIIGFFLGFGFISGPLAWKKGADLKEEFESRGLQPAAETQVAYYSGMLSTMLVGVSLGVMLLLMFLML